MMHAQSDLRGTLELSHRYERSKRLLNEAVAERDRSKVIRANIFIDSDDFSQVPDDEQLEMLALLATALLATGWGAP